MLNGLSVSRNNQNAKERAWKEMQHKINIEEGTGLPVMLIVNRVRGH